jgi:hypothetical protein
MHGELDTADGGSAGGINTMTKTNALRILETAKVAYTAREYDVSDGELSGLAIAIERFIDLDYLGRD